MEDYLEKQLDRVNSWLSFAEAKNAALIAFDVAILTICADWYEKSPVFSIIVAIIFVLSGMLCLLSFSPKLTSKVEPINSVLNTSDLNLIYFGDIAKFQNEDDYIEQVRLRYYPNVSPKDAKENQKMDFASEILINSRITVSKYGIFKKALYIDLIAFVLIVVLLVIA